MTLVDPNDESVHPHTHAADWRIYSRGPIYKSVCTRLSDEQATQRINKEEPPEIGHWKLANEPFQTGQPNGFPCPGRPRTHRHLLFGLL